MNRHITISYQGELLGPFTSEAEAIAALEARRSAKDAALEARIAGLPAGKTPDWTTAERHAAADKACGREWVCACGACKIARKTPAPAKLTQKRVREDLSAIGVSFRATGYGRPEYRVNLRGGLESTAYYTDDLLDALGTGRKMAAAAAPGTITPVKGGFRITRTIDPLTGEEYER